MTLDEFKRSGGRTWPGGYTLAAIMDGGALMCFACVLAEDVHEGGDADGWRFEDADVYWEGHPWYCAHCNSETPSEYGDPDAEECDQ